MCTFHAPIRAPRPSSRLWALALIAALPASHGLAATIVDALWQGRTPPPPLGDNVNWSDPNNWAPAGVPKNLDDTLWYNVTLPEGVTVTYDAQASIPGPTLLGQSQLNNFTLANDATLILTTSGPTQPGLTINGNALLAGILDVRAGTFNAPNASFFDSPFVDTSTNRARIYASGGAVVHIGAYYYLSAGLVGQKGAAQDINLFTASGTGTLLDLSTLLNLNASFNHVGTIEHQVVSASAGGKIDLSSLLFIEVPSSVQDHLQFTAAGPDSEINLSQLRSVTSQANGTLRVAVNSGGKITAGRLWSDAIAQVTVSDPGSRLVVNNGAWIPTGTTLTQGPNTSVTVGQDLSLEAGGIYTTGSNAQLQLGRDLLNSTTTPANLFLKPATVTFTGASPTQIVEAAGKDVGLATSSLSNSNFAFGAMHIGAPGKPASVLLMDIRDNGNRSSSPEAVYANVDGADINQDGTPGDEGLYIAAGSTLVLNGLHLYAFHGGSLVQVTPTPSWPNGGGAIVQAITAPTGDVNFDNHIDSHDIDLEFDAVHGPALHPFFDLDANGSISMRDVDFLIHDVLHTEFGDANLDGAVDVFDLIALVNHWQQKGALWADADFNGDGNVNAFDLNTLASHWGFHSGALAAPLALQSLSVTPVPEPASLLLLLPAILGLRRRQRR